MPAVRHALRRAAVAFKHLHAMQPNRVPATTVLEGKLSLVPPGLCDVLQWTGAQQPNKLFAQTRTRSLQAEKCVVATSLKANAKARLFKSRLKPSKIGPLSSVVASK